MTGACRFTAQRRILSHYSLRENMCVYTTCVYVGGGWCKQARMAAFFKSGRVVWTVTLGLRSLHGPQSAVPDPGVCVLYAFMCYSHSHHAALGCTAGPATANTPREGAEWLQSVCRSMPSLLIIQASSHAWTRSFNLAHLTRPPCAPWRLQDLAGWIRPLFKTTHLGSLTGWRGGGVSLLKLLPYSCPMGARLLNR